jgi:hypothetical protein
MEPAEAKLIAAPPKGDPEQLVNGALNVTGSRRGRKGRAAEEVARYFLAKEGATLAKPELGEEAQGESDALIKAFRLKDGVFYVVTAYRAEAEIQEGNPILVKRPLEKWRGEK